MPLPGLRRVPKLCEKHSSAINITSIGYTGNSKHHATAPTASIHIGCVITTAPKAICFAQVAIGGSMLLANHFTISIASGDPFSTIKINGGIGNSPTLTAPPTPPPPARAPRTSPSPTPPDPVASDPRAAGRLYGHSSVSGDAVLQPPAYRRTCTRRHPLRSTPTTDKERLAMLTLIEDLPPNVVGVEAHEPVTAEDYGNVLVPAVDAAHSASEDGKVRLLYVLGHDVPDFTAGAMWQDTKLGVGHLRTWERVAIVSDADWLRHAIDAFGWVMPGEIKVFNAEGLNDARAWVTA